MEKEIVVSYSETHPKPGKYSSSTFFASEKFKITINTPEEYKVEFDKAFSRVQAIVGGQVEAAGNDGRIIEIQEEVRS